jgi:hypothetical protein
MASRSLLLTIFAFFALLACAAAAPQQGERAPRGPGRVTAGVSGRAAAPGHPAAHATPHPASRPREHHTARHHTARHRLPHPCARREISPGRTGTTPTPHKRARPGRRARPLPQLLTPGRTPHAAAPCASGPPAHARPLPPNPLPRPAGANRKLLQGWPEPPITVATPAGPMVIRRYPVSVQNIVGGNVFLPNFILRGRGSKP